MIRRGLWSPSCLWYSLKRKLPRREDDGEAKRRWSGEGWENSTSPRIESNRAIYRRSGFKANRRRNCEAKGRERGGGSGKYFMAIFWRRIWNACEHRSVSEPPPRILLLPIKLPSQRKGSQRNTNILRSFEYYMVCCSSLKERFVRIIVVICFGLWRLGSGAETRTTKLAPRLSLPSPSLLSSSSSGKLGANHILLPATFKIASS